MKHIDVYRIGWWSGPRLRQLRVLARILITDRQPDAPADGIANRGHRRAMAKAIRGELSRPWRLHRPWQAEATYVSANARRALTAKGAEAKIERDLGYRFELALAVGRHKPRCWSCGGPGLASGCGCQVVPRQGGVQ